MDDIHFRRLKINLKGNSFFSWMEPYGQPKLHETRNFGIGRLRFEANDPKMTFGHVIFNFSLLVFPNFSNFYCNFKL